MAGRGGQQEGRGRSGGRGAQGRGGRGTYSAVPPPPPGGTPGRGRGAQARVAAPAFSTPGRGPSPGRGRGGGRAVPQAGRGRSPFAGRGSPGASGASGSGYSLAHGGLGGGRVWGRGAEAVAWDHEKERGLLKVGPPAGARFSPAWLRGLTSFVAWRCQQQGAAQPPPPPPQAGAAGSHVDEQQQQAAVEARLQQLQLAGSEEQQQQQRPPVTAERLPATPPRPPVTVERVAGTSGSEGHEWEPSAEAAAAEGGLSAESSHLGGGDSDEQEEAEALAAGASRASSPASSAGSDLGWASLLAPAAAQAAAAESAASASSQGAAVSDEAAANGCSSAPSSEGGEVTSADGSRHWWPASPASLAAAEPVAVDTQPAAPAPAAAVVLPPGGARIQLSLRLERMALTDREAAMLADWCCEHAAVADVRKLWLFDNRLSDEGASSLARILQAHPRMLEVHLSHNLLSLAGATALLEAVQVAGSPPAAAPEGEEEQAPAALAAAAAAQLPSKPLWLRLEWNRISLEGLMGALEEQHTRRGLVADLPAAIRQDAAPSLPDLPPYLAAATAAAPAAPTTAPASRGARNALQYMVDGCHARLPWISCQFQLPSEAAVLKAARSGWRAQQQGEQQQGEQQQGEQREPASGSTGAPATPAHGTAGVAGDASAAAAGPAAGPLLVFPDTSALLPMLGAGDRVSIPTFLTLDHMLELARARRFGRALPPHEQVFLVVTDSVCKQLDGLKNDPAARGPIRRFFGQLLDACGPAGADFLTVLGAHEGEGLVVDADAEVAGSRSVDVATKGHRADHRIVEVALFFQDEVMREAASAPSTSSPGGAASSGATSGGASASALSAASFPVLLLSGDNGQVATARSHGLPAAKMSNLPALQAALGGGSAAPPLTASLLRACLGGAAVAGLGRAATRSLQAEFDDGVAALQLAVEALQASQQALAAAGLPTGDAQLLPALRARLAGLQERVASHQDPSRLLRWASRGSASAADGASGGPCPA